LGARELDRKFGAVGAAKIAMPVVVEMEFPAAGCLPQNHRIEAAAKVDVREADLFAPDVFARALHGACARARGAKQRAVHVEEQERKWSRHGFGSETAIACSSWRGA